VIRNRWLRWFGHVERKDAGNWVRKCMTLEVDGKRPRGRPKKTWWETIESDMKIVGLKREDAVDRIAWRRGLRSTGGGKNVTFGGGVIR